MAEIIQPGFSRMNALRDPRRMEKGEVVTKYVCSTCQTKWGPWRFVRGVFGTPNGIWNGRFKQATNNGPGPKMGGPFEENPPE